MKLENIAQTMTPLPLSSHGKPVDSFSQAAELENELKRMVKGEVRFDRGSRALYAADGSNYRQIPIGLVVPRDDEDVIGTVAACRKYGAPELPRGAGTSLAGQCCNVAVVLDFTKYMNKILEINRTGDSLEFSQASSWTRCAIKPRNTISLLAPILPRTAAARWEE